MTLVGLIILRAGPAQSVGADGRDLELTVVWLPLYVTGAAADDCRDRAATSTDRIRMMINSTPDVRVAISHSI